MHAAPLLPWLALHEYLAASSARRETRTPVSVYAITFIGPLNYNAKSQGEGAAAAAAAAERSNDREEEEGRRRNV
jgi:hypothetical protein